MTLLADLPVQRKLRYAMLLTSSLALTVACAVFLAVEYVGYRRNLVQTVVTLAQVTADNSTAPIAFSDAAAARQTLEALHAEPQITLAVLYDATGKQVASYVARAGEILPDQPPAANGVHLVDGELVTAQPVVEDGRRLGTLYLRATQSVMFDRMRTSAWLALAVLGLTSVLAAVIAGLLGRTLARPILELDRTALAVSMDQDYSLRARQYGDDELGRLTAAFNAMMATTQKSVEALRESEQRFRVLADHAPVLIWLADPHGHFVWFNQRWLDFTGRSLAGELGRGWLEGVQPEEREGVWRAHEEAFAEQRAFQLEYRLRRHDQADRWVLSQGLPRFDAANNFAGFVGSAIDVSDRKLAEQEVAEARDRAIAASRAKDNFLAALSHELRTPLTPVLLLATEEANNPRLADEVRADFGMIAKNVALEARLIDDLLDLTRITRGKLVLDRRSVDVHEIFEDALTNVQPDFTAKAIAVEVNLAAPRHRLVGDPVRLQQIFWNVLKNAAKFTPEGGRVSIASSILDHDLLRVSVSDTGIGLTPREVDRIFEAFAQGEHAETTAGHRFGGLGLGLAITQRLVQLHHGSIRALSAGRGEGATFQIDLPLEEDEAEPAPAGGGSAATAAFQSATTGAPPDARFGSGSDI